MKLGEAVTPDDPRIFRQLKRAELVMLVAIRHHHNVHLPLSHGLPREEGSRCPPTNRGEDLSGGVAKPRGAVLLEQLVAGGCGMGTTARERYWTWDP